MLLTVTMRQNLRQPEERKCFGFIGVSVSVLLVVAAAIAALSQTPSSTAHPEPSNSVQPVTITLEEAIKRAEASEPGYAAIAAESKAAALDRSIARAGLLPGAGYHNQAIYTQPYRVRNPAGQIIESQSSQIFIANNAVREYASQAVVNETLGLGGLAGIRRADASQALAAAELEIARRGLVAAVTGMYYGAIAADNKLMVAERAHTEVVKFLDLTNKREQGRESAHADVVKAQLVEQQRTRDLADAKVAAEKARLELAVLLFPDPRTPYVLAAAKGTPGLPSRTEVEQAAARNNPELKSALAALGVSNADVLAARAGYLPDLGLNFTYGIDAAQFAVNGPDGGRNLGYSASITLDIPVWDWFSTQHRVRQSEIRRDAAKVALTAAQRRLIARLDEIYSEAATAREQLESLDASVETARESLRLTKLRYTGGEATVLEIVDAQNAFVGAENAREDGSVRYQIAWADLETLTGTL